MDSFDIDLEFLTRHASARLKLVCELKFRLTEVSLRDYDLKLLM